MFPSSFVFRDDVTLLFRANKMAISDIGYAGVAIQPGETVQRNAKWPIKVYLPIGTKATNEAFLQANKALKRV